MRVHRIYLIAGEASGDMHGAALIRELKGLYPEARLRGWGGDMMEEAGMELVRHYRETAFMGFVEVARNLPTVLKLLREAGEDLRNFDPEMLVLIDYPGFNLRMARFAQRLRCKVVYYISPQLWAWKENRIRTVRQCVDLMLCILPFEEAWYAQRGVQARYVGHPLADTCFPLSAESRIAVRNQLCSDPGCRIGPETKWVALLPGSRKQEVRMHLPVMLEAVRSLPDTVAVVAMAPGLDPEFYRQFGGQPAPATRASLERSPTTKDDKGPGVVWLGGRTRDILGCADAALVASGTATLEAALLDCPLVAVYRVNALSYLIGKALVKVPYVSLVNLILDREAVPERLQDRMNPGQLAQDLLTLQDPLSVAASAQHLAFAELRRCLAPSDHRSASARAAAHIANSGLFSPT
jgi:lipid-A-disaccharide synthase